MLKKMIVVGLMTCMLSALFAGCGRQEQTSTQAPRQSASDTASTANDKNPETAATESIGSSEAADDSEDLAEVNMVFVCTSAIPPDVKVVETALNEITEKKINTHVNIEMIEIGSYDQQIGLKASSNEKVDLLLSIPIGASSFNNMAAQNQLMDITDYMKADAQETLDLVGGLMEATTKSGRIIGVPTYRTLVSSEYIIMRTDVLEDLGLLEKAKNMTSMSEYTEILDAVKSSDKWNYLAGIVASDGQGTCMTLEGGYIGVDAFSDARAYDQLGDLNRVIAIDPSGADPTVKNNFASDEYKAMWQQMKEWYDLGYVYKDVATTKEMAEELVKSNVAFSYFSQSEIGVETTKSAACGMPVTCVKILTLPVSTSSCIKFVWTVPSSATEPEAAVKFLNMMYTDPEIENLLAWGVEGVHYQVKDGEACYMDNEDATTCRYHMKDFLFGNQFNCLPWDGQGADFREVSKKEMDESAISAYLGFSCDTTAVQNEISAITNVLAEYRPTIDSGLASAQDYDAFLNKMDASGLPRIIEEYQNQLDEWLNENK